MTTLSPKSSRFMQIPIRVHILTWAQGTGALQHPSLPQDASCALRGHPKPTPLDRWGQTPCASMGCQAEGLWVPRKARLGAGMG